MNEFFWEFLINCWVANVTEQWKCQGSENETKPKFQHHKKFSAPQISVTVFNGYRIFQFTQSVWSWLVSKRQYFSACSFDCYFQNKSVGKGGGSLELKPFLQTFRPLLMFKIVFRDSSLYPKQLCLFRPLWLSSVLTALANGQWSMVYCFIWLSQQAEAS